MGSSSGAGQESSMGSSSSITNTSSSLQPQSGSYSMDRHLRARDDPINARMNDPRRWQGQSFTATPTGATRNYFPKVIGGSGASHSTISEQDILLTKVGGSLNG